MLNRNRPNVRGCAKTADGYNMSGKHYARSSSTTRPPRDVGTRDEQDGESIGKECDCSGDNRTPILQGGEVAFPEEVRALRARAAAGNLRHLSAD